MSTHGDRRTRGRVGAPAAVAVAAVLGCMVVGDADSASPLAPALPAQPGIAAASGSCAVANDHARWTRLHAEVDATWSTWVDPWTPCTQYMAHDAQTLRRSSDGGRSWQLAFSDQSADVACPSAVAAASCPRQFAADSLDIPEPGSVVLGEAGSGDAVVASTDSGHSWTLRNGGTTGIAGRAVGSMVFAPGDPFVAYAAVSVSPSSPAHLYVTRDGGVTWAPTTQPATGPVAIDPAHPGHLWVLNPPVLLESSDYGTTWSDSNAPDSWSANGIHDYQPLQLVVIATLRHPLRLFVVGSLTDLTGSGSTTHTGLMYSDDDGATWSDAAAPGDGLALAADPADQDRMLLVSSVTNDSGTATLAATLSGDGFDTAIEVAAPFAGAYRPTATPYGGGAVVPVSSAALHAATQRTGPHDTVPAPAPTPAVQLQADNHGAFYLLAAQACADIRRTAADSGCSVHGAVRQELLRFSGEPARPIPSAATNGTSGPLPAGVVTPTVTPMTQRSTCRMPAVSDGGLGGTLAYDGVDLLYTNYNETGPTSYQGVIHKMSPRTCADTGVIVVSFRPEDLARIHSGPCYADSSHVDLVHPRLDSIAYDTVHNEIWGALVSSFDYRAGQMLGGDVVGSCLVRITLSDLDAPLAAGIAHLDFVNGCGTMLTVDPFTDTLWTCDVRLGNANRDDVSRASDHINLPGGALMPTCMTGRTDSQVLVQPQNPGRLSGNFSSWTIGAPGHIYVQDEDDSTVIDWDVIGCRDTRYYAHRVYSESQAEDDGIACDASTFGVDTPVMWIRDAAPETVTAYDLPGGRCPLATLTRYLGPAAALQGQPVQLCAQLTLKSRPVSLGGLLLRFAVDGSDAGTAQTGPDGVACDPYVAAIAAGRHHVDVAFTGDRAYYPSADRGILDITLPATTTAVPRSDAKAPAAAQLPPPPVVPNLNPVQAPNPAQQVQPQTQPQPEPAPQPQAMVQGQPVGAVQADHQAEPQMVVALQGQAAGEELGQSYEMTALGAGEGSPAWEVIPRAVGPALLALLVGCGAVWTLRGEPGIRGDEAAVRRRRRRRST